MLTDIMKQLKTAIILLALFTLLTGLIYPAIITGIAQLLFPWKANGSIIQQQGQAIGSALIGQSFETAKYFWGRPSATTSFPDNAASSTGSNLGPSNPALIALVEKRIEKLKQMDPSNNGLVPVDLATASGSGLDPDISPKAAFYQVPRIAMTRGLSQAAVHALVERLIQNRTFGFLGEPRVNVLELNLALDQLTVNSEVK